MAKQQKPDDPETPERDEALDILNTLAEPEPAPVAPAAPDPWVVMGQVAAALQAIATKLDSPTAAAGTGEQLLAIQEQLVRTMDRLADANIQGAQIIATETKRAHRPSNEVVPGISVFNRRGSQLPDDAEGPRKPPLKCVMLLPWLAEWESMTREEVELLNLLQPGEFVLKRIDNSKVRVEVRIDYKVDNVTPSRLILRHDTAFNNDNFKLVPPLNEMLRQVLKQHDSSIRQRAAAVLTDEEEEALIEAGELTTAA